MANASSDPAKNLSTLALFIATDIRNAIMAAFVTHVADAWFHQFTAEEQRKRFRTNPANTLVYSALAALEKQSIVSVSETLKDEDGLHPHDAEIRRKEDLVLHRHAISHPATVQWKWPKMQAFVEAGRDGYDFRPGQIWDLQRSINEELRRHGLPGHNEQVPVTKDMAASLHLILDLARLPEFPIPSVDVLVAYLQEQAPKFQAVLEKHPDGARDPEREKERAERRRLRRERWAEEAKMRQTDSASEAD